MVQYHNTLPSLLMWSETNLGGEGEKESIPYYAAVQATEYLTLLLT